MSGENGKARPSMAATLGLAAGVVGLAAIALGAAGSRFGLLAPQVGFRTFAAGLAGGGLAGLVAGFVGVVATRTGGRRSGRGRAWGAVLLGLALTTGLALLLSRAADAPAIHDLTTDLADPPQFRAAAQHPDNRGRDLTYPDGGPQVPALQARAYRDLRPLRLDRPPDEAFAAALSAAEALGWSVTWANAELGLIEAFDRSPIFRFVDDVVVRVRAAPDGGSVVDLRSLSRVGVSDLGANARRIRRFLDRLQ